MTLSRLQLSLLLVAAAVVGGVVTSALTRILDGGPDEEEAQPASVTLVGSPEEWSPGLSRLGTDLEIGDPRISFRQLDDIAVRLAMKNPEEAVLAARDIPGHDNREAYFDSVLTTWGETDGKTAAEWSLEHFQGQRLTDALYYVADGWAEADPEGAAEWFVENTEGPIFDDSMWEVLEAWGRKDPEKAFAWAESNLEDFEKENVMFGLSEGWAAVDPEGAMKAGMKMWNGEEPWAYDFLVAVATQWAGSDPAAAATWGEAILHEGLREGILMELGENWAHQDPAAAAEWVASIEDPGSRRFAESGVAIGWSEFDPGEALAWALEHGSDPEQREDMVGDIMFNWTNLDARGAVNWLREAPPGEGRDTVLEIFSDSIVADDPEAAIAWAREIVDVAKRNEHLSGLLQDWIDFEGAYAANEIRKLDLPAEVLETVRFPK